jgi:hypothetical protein
VQVAFYVENKWKSSAILHRKISCKTENKNVIKTRILKKTSRYINIIKEFNNISVMNGIIMTIKKKC